MEYAYLLNVAMDHDPGDAVYCAMVVLSPASARGLLRCMQIVDVARAADPLIQGVIVEDHQLEFFEPAMDDYATAELAQTMLATSVLPLQNLRPEQKRTYILNRQECVVTANQIHWQGYTPQTAIQVRTAALSRTIIEMAASSAPTIAATAPAAALGGADDIPASVSAQL